MNKLVIIVTSLMLGAACILKPEIPTQTEPDKYFIVDVGNLVVRFDTVQDARHVFCILETVCVLKPEIPTQTKPDK